MPDVKDSLNTIFTHLSGSLRAPLERAAPFYASEVQEIVLRAARPVVIECGGKRYYLTRGGALTAVYASRDLLCTSAAELSEILRSICEYSVYSRQVELNQGFVTVRNGVRVGICGTAVERDGAIVNIKELSTLSFRVACEHPGCADELLRLVDPLGGILLCGPPCSGKTTLIRDMARTLSQRFKVSVLDERGEISASLGGVSAYDVGLSDVFVGMKKGVGVMTALRSLSPDILICDELGERDDAEAIRYALRCGAAMIATVHAGGMDDLRSREMTASLLATGAFRYVVQLFDRRRAGRVRTIYELRG